jgi:two-component system NarL family response regulator
MDQVMSVAGQRIRVFCVDDHRVMLEGLALLIGRQADMEVVGSATNGEEAIDSVARMKPDVTLMDLQLPGVSGLDAIRKIRQSDPHARIVVLTMYQGDEDIYRALEAGAATYLLKDALSEDLVRVIREVHSGGKPLGATSKAALAGRAQAAAAHAARGRGGAAHCRRDAQQGDRR